MKYHLPFLVFIAALAFIPAAGQSAGQSKEPPPLPGPNASLAELEGWLKYAVQENSKVRSEYETIDLQEVDIQQCALTFRWRTATLRRPPVRNTGYKSPTPEDVRRANQSVPTPRSAAMPPVTSRYDYAGFYVDLRDIDAAKIKLQSSRFGEGYFGVVMRTLGEKGAVLSKNGSKIPKAEKDRKPGTGLFQQTFLGITIKQEVGFDIRSALIRTVKLCQAAK